jgi:hypothetical protein
LLTEVTEFTRLIEVAILLCFSSTHNIPAIGIAHHTLVVNKSACTKMALKIVEHFDSSFTLDPEAKEALFSLLKGETFLKQIIEQMQCAKVEFTELLFQPVPYSTTTPKGMPAEFEKYHESNDHAIINVPPNFMFKAKIFKPSRLCAIYRKVN